MWLTSGATFAGYTIVRQLDRGGMGEIYLAEHPRLPRWYALKILPELLTADAEFRARFFHEADAAAMLNHPHIIAIRDRGEFAGRLWIAMDYVDGIDAEQLMAQRFSTGMPVDQALAIVSAIADALDYAHQRGLLHRDVKSANVLLTAPGAESQRIMLADFGVARQLDIAGTLTASGSIDGRADQYALASMAFRLLTGALPSVGDNPVAAIRQKLRTAPPKLSDHSPELERLDEVMTAALAKDPADRFGSCREFADALSRRVDSARLSRRQRRWLARGSAIGVVSATALLTVWMVQRHHDDAATGAATAITKPSFPVSTTTAASRVPAAPPKLDGVYRVDTNRSRQTFNGIPNPQPPDVTTWWAFRSVCQPAGCVAAGVMLDDSHQAASAAGGELRLDFFDGQWESRPLTARFPCVNANGRAGMQTTTEVLSLRLSDHGTIRGEMTVTVETNECGQQGGVIQVPTAAVRRSGVPPDVEVPDPAAPTIGTTPTR